MTDSALSLLGLALRGNNLAIGEEPVAEACKAGRARLVLTAADAAQNSADRAGRMCAVAALTDRGLAAALAEKLAGRDEDLRPIASLLNETKKSRAGMKRPAAPEI